MKRKRDNFSAAVIRDLERRVGCKCSNPDCRVPTSGPKTAPNGVNNIGIAAHIAAASPGGPRFDPSMSKEERTSINNAIWLCANCSIKVDKDSYAYSVATLKRWKECAEREAAEELGKEPVSRRSYDHLHALALGSLKKSRIADAISNIAQLSKQAIEEIDPRFSVEVEYQNGVTSYSLTARETVHIRTTIAPEYTSEFLEKFKAFREHGTDLEIDLRGLSFEGSKLFELDGTTGGKFVMSTNTRAEAILKFRQNESPSICRSLLDDIKGEIVGGAKSFTFTGRSCADILCFEFQFSINAVGKQTCISTFSVDFSKWIERPLRLLPYFEKIFSFYEAVVVGKNVSFDLECEGNPIAHGKANHHDIQVQVRQMYGSLLFVHRVRAVLQALNLDTPFVEGITISEDDFDKVSTLYGMLHEYEQQRDVTISPIDATILLPSNWGESGEDKLLSGAPSAFRIEFEYDWTVNLYGMTIPSPKVALTYSSMQLMTDAPQSEFVAGKSFKVKLVPTLDCTVDVQLIPVSIAPAPTP